MASLGTQLAQQRLRASVAARKLVARVSAQGFLAKITIPAYSFSARAVVLTASTAYQRLRIREILLGAAPNINNSTLNTSALNTFTLG